MAFRKRVYAGTRSGSRKRARFMKRRRFSRKRRNAAYSSQRGNTVFAGFRGRKIPYRKYKRILWNASTLAEHHRSYNMSSVGLTAPASNLNMRVQAFPMINDNFWAVVGGASADLTFDTDIFIRGGIATCRIRNNDAAPVHCTVWKIVTTDNGDTNFLTGGSTFRAMWDPSVTVDFERFYRIKQRFAFTVEPGDSNSLMHYIGSRKVEGSPFNNAHRRDYWVIGVNSSGSSEDNVTVQTGHNISFTLDRY